MYPSPGSVRVRALTVFNSCRRSHSGRRGRAVARLGRLSTGGLVWAGPLLAAAGCSSVVEPGGGSREIEALPRALSLAESDAIAASNAFGFDLLRELAARDRGASIFLSPFSASMALGMTMNGASGGTFDAMRQTLRFGTLTEEEINAAYRGLLGLLATLDPDVEIAVGNAIWHRAELTVEPGFRERVETAFDARIQGLGFATTSAATTINNWVREATGGRITEMVTPPIPDYIVAYLMNAVYFKAGWRRRFDPDDTFEAPFHELDGSTAPVELMWRDDTIPIYRGDGFVAADLGYAGNAFSMTVVVPEEGTTVYDLVERLDAEAWAAITAGLHAGPALLFLPRFELEWEETLNDALRAMGMDVAFTDAADFSRLFGTQGLLIDEVKQKSFVRVDEEGTEAAAVTSVAIGVTSVPVKTMVRADRPFLFAIRERFSGTILFLGLIVEPPTL